LAFATVLSFLTHHGNKKLDRRLACHRRNDRLKAYPATYVSLSRLTSACVRLESLTYGQGRKPILRFLTYGSSHPLMRPNMPTKTTCMLIAFAWLLSPSFVLAQQNVVVVLDDSGSMRDRMTGNRNMSKMDAARSALTQVLQSLPDDANVGVLTLNTRSGNDNWIAPLGLVERGEIANQISRISATGGTPLGEAMQIAADALLDARQKQMYGTYRMLIVTDGEASDPELVDQYLPMARARGLMIDVIGVSMPGDHSLATQVQSYRRADDPNSLTRALAEVFAETSEEPSDAGDSDYDMIAGLPDEVAASALETLAQSNNTLLADSPPGEFPNSAGNTPFNSSPRSQPTAAAGSLLTGGFCCLASLGLLVVFPIVLLKLGGTKNPTNRSKYRR